ncbi:MAG: hypothetical protein PHS14_01435 [Elusimicrobia bacterium]|nr:hypothetical protein [Elusimicrobiota bacterium]
MNIDLRGMFGRCAVGVGLLVVTAMSGRDWPIRAGAAGRAESIVADWPEPSRLTARAMIEKYGQPNRRDRDSLTWFGLFRGRRTVVHRSSSGEGMVEQVVLYRVPAAKVSLLALFDRRLTVDRDASELTARTESARTNFLLLNLAHEIASGFKTVGTAQVFRDKEMRLAEAGKSSRYRDRLIFEGPLPVPAPQR